MISSGRDPTDPVPDQLLALLDEIDEAGSDAVFARRLADHNRRAVLAARINTPTWTESRESSKSTELRSTPSKPATSHC